MLVKECDYQIENLLSAALNCSGQLTWRQQEWMGLTQEDMGWTVSFFDVYSVCTWQRGRTAPQRCRDCSGDRESDC